jgi:hypothetical protein
MSQPIACPCCLHEETIRARSAGREPFPDCDSIDADGIHTDTRRAWAGGQHSPTT